MDTHEIILTLLAACIGAIGAVVIHTKTYQAVSE